MQLVSDATKLNVIAEFGGFFFFLGRTMHGVSCAPDLLQVSCRVAIYAIYSYYLIFPRGSNDRRMFFVVVLFSIDPVRAIN